MQRRHVADDIVVGQLEIDVGFAVLVVSISRPSRFRRSHSGVFGSACSRLMVSSGICDSSMKSRDVSAGLRLVGVEPEDDAGRDLHAVGVDRLDRLP